MHVLAQLKDDVEFIKSLDGIIEAFRTTALMQFQAFQSRRELESLFFREIDRSFYCLRNSGEGLYNTYQHAGLPSLIVAITSDEGFLGELNTLVINAALDHCKHEHDELLVLGERGARYLEDMHRPYVSLPGITEKIEQREITRLRNYIIERFARSCGRVFIVHPEFISLGEQRVASVGLLPFETPQKTSRSPRGEDTDMLIEPHAQAIFDVLVEMWLRERLRDIFFVSKQAEYAARIMHLESSMQGLGYMQKKVTFDYFKLAHSLSDKTIREIMAAKILLKK